MTGSTHGLTAEDLDVQARARMLADELIPYEVEAELNDGELDPAVLEKQHARVVGAGARGHQHPGRAGRPGADVPAAGAGPGAGQPGDQRPRLDPVDAAAVVHRGRVGAPARAVAGADGARRAARVLRDHRGGRRVGRRRARGDRAPRGRRVRAGRGQVARHVVQRRRVLLLPGEADRGAARRRARDVRRRPALPRRARGAHAGVLAHHQPPPPDRGVRGRARAGRPARRCRG